LVAKPVQIDTDTSPLGPMVRGVFGPDIKTLKIGQLRTPNHMGLELYQFVSPKTDKPTPTFSAREGVLRLAIVEPHIDGLVDKIVKAGGRVLFRGEPSGSRQVVFCADPDGNPIEIATSAW